MSSDAAARVSDRPTVVVQPDFRTGLPLNITLFTVGGFWLLLGLIAALNQHLLWTLICCMLGFAFYATVLLYYRNASLWADGHWTGSTDLLGRRVACARGDITSVEDIRWITHRIVFLHRDGRRAFQVYSYGWKPEAIASFRRELGLSQTELNL